MTTYSPTEYTQNQVHYKKCAKNHQGDKVHKLPGVAHGVMDLQAMLKKVLKGMSGKAFNLIIYRGFHSWKSLTLYDTAVSIEVNKEM